MLAIKRILILYAYTCTLPWVRVVRRYLNFHLLVQYDIKVRTKYRDQTSLLFIKNDTQNCFLQCMKYPLYSMAYLIKQRTCTPINITVILNMPGRVKIIF